MRLKKNNIKSNFIYNFMYQILTMLIPLITAPYLSRILGSENLGVYSYVYSVVYYFMIFIVLGLENYGNRTIAKNRENKDMLSKTFWEIYFLQLFCGIFVILIYFLFINTFFNNYKLNFIIQSMFIISAMLDINWFFFGIEKFKITVTRNTIVKLLSLILIFVYVKGETDLIKYTFIMSFSTLISQVLLWPFLFKEIKFCNVEFKNVIKHLIPNLKLFIPVIAVSIYKMMDKVMLGSISNIREVAFYENAEKVIKVPNTIISALGVVMMPRISNLLSNNNYVLIKNYVKKSISFICFLSFPITFGIICISDNFVPIYFGDKFEKTGTILSLLAVTIPMLGWGNVIRTQYLIPKERDRDFIISAFLGALINLIFNLIFIPKYASIGACIGTILAEFTVMIYQTISVRKELEINEYIKSIIPFLVKSFIMFIVIYPFNFLNLNEFLRIIIQIVLGCVIYFFLNYKYVISLVNLDHILFEKIRKS